MSLHIDRFIDKVQGHNARGAGVVTLDPKEANDLLADITRLLLQLETARSAVTNQHQESTVTVAMSGGSY